MRQLKTLAGVVAASVYSVSTFSLGILFFGKHINGSIPCSAASMCNEVSELSISTPFGIPLSLIGFVISLACLVLMLANKNLKPVFFLELFAGFASLGLQIYVRKTYQLNCHWCLIAAVSLVVGSTITLTQKQPIKSDFLTKLALVFLVFAGGLGYAGRQATGSKQKGKLFTGDAAKQIYQRAKGKKFMVFSCITCPACQALYSNLIAAKKLAMPAYITYDVHHRPDNLKLQVQFKTEMSKSLKGLDVAQSYNGLSTPKPNIPIDKEELAKVTEEDAFAKTIKIAETPTILEIVEEKMIRVVDSNYMLDNLK
jgi:uncharacterized membrane protein